MNDKLTPVSRQFYTPRELAIGLGVSMPTMYRWLWSGKVRSIHVGQQLRISKAEVARILEKGTRRVRD